MEFGGRFGVWQGARHGLNRGIHSSWQQSLGDRSPGVLLGWELTTDDHHCLVSSGLLSISSGDPAAPQWQHVGWHEIERGGFDGDSLTLHWRRYDAEDEERVSLSKPGRVAELFRERVAASIAVEQFFPLTDSRSDRGVIISGRRDLSRPEAPLQWHASLSKGTTWQTPGIRDFADSAIDRLRAEYDPEH